MYKILGGGCQKRLRKSLVFGQLSQVSNPPPHGHIVETMDWEWDDMFPYLEKYQYYWNINFFVGWIFKALVNFHLTIIKAPSENRIKKYCA